MTSKLLVLLCSTFINFPAVFLLWSCTSQFFQSRFQGYHREQGADTSRRIQELTFFLLRALKETDDTALRRFPFGLSFHSVQSYTADWTWWNRPGCGPKPEQDLLLSHYERKDCTDRIAASPFVFFPNFANRSIDTPRGVCERPFFPMLIVRPRLIHMRVHFLYSPHNRTGGLPNRKGLWSRCTAVQFVFFLLPPSRHIWKA